MTFSNVSEWSSDKEAAAGVDVETGMEGMDEDDDGKFLQQQQQQQNIISPVLTFSLSISDISA